MTNHAAVVLFVKNEQHDIMGWISWYISLGFDLIYIYDDHSTDGTYEICKAASNIFNIELQKTSLEQENFYFRQRDSYIDACKKSIGLFNWIAFVDADEYLYLDNCHNICDYLNSFDSNVSGIALNWKIYGSSGKVIKNNIPIFENFIYHSNESLHDNSLVKSIIRPEKMSDFYENPHKFNLISGDYVDSIGNKVDWEPGATKKILWERAWVNHYICRSMEHYVDRIKRRIGVDLSNTTVYWDHFNKNDLCAYVENSFIEKNSEIINKIKKEVVKCFINKLYGEYKSLSYPFLEGNKKTKNLKIFQIKSFHGLLLSTNNIDGHVIQSDNKNYIYIIVDENSNSSFIFRKNNDIISNIKFHIFSENRKEYIYRYKFEKINTNIISLQSCESDRYLTAINPEINNIVECTRSIVSHWEQFEIIKCSDDLDFDLDLNFDFPLNSKDFEEKIINNFGRKNINEFIIMFNMMDDHSKKEIVLRSNGALSWLL